LFGRWATRRCRDEDLPKLSQTKLIVKNDLADQAPQSSGTEQFALGEAGRRAGTYTYHAGNGRGVRWEDATRGVLWLCCTSEQHDGGYAHGHALLNAGKLYPTLDPAYAGNGCATVAWGTCPDEDTLEWGRIILGLIEAVESQRSAFEAGAAITFNHLGHSLAELSLEDGMTTLRIRRNLVYPDAAVGRDRFFEDEETLDLLHQLTGDTLVEEAYEIETFPYDRYWLTIYFYGEIVTPEEWIEARLDEALIKKAYRLPDEDAGL
jgi:hypothetical protein